MVMEDYGSKLFPRAIGYSAGLIDYFFRGRMQVVLSEDQPSESEVHVQVSNTTPNEDTMNMPAEVKGVLEYELSGQKFFNVSPSQPVTLTSSPQDLVFPLTPPPGAENAFLNVVYKGQLGLEEQAVMVGKAPFMDLRPKDPMLVCPDGSVQFTVVGGKAPYTWSTTKGEITPDPDTKGAVLTPPDNNANVGGVAYVRIAGAVTDDKPAACLAGFVVATSYNCADEVVAPCQQANDQAVEACGGTFVECVAGSEEICADNVALACHQPGATDCGLPECGEVQVESQEVCEFVSANPSVAPICDQRTQDMIDAGCRPCAEEMEGGAVVTVTDSAGASDSTMVTVQ